MKQCARSHIALLLTVIYTLIIVGPLTPLALRNAAFAHAVTGECAGDCAICGCAPEKSANRTCCCWKKKRQHDHGHEEAQSGECCKKNQQNKKTVMSCGCPCGGNKLLACWSGESSEQLPFQFSADPPAFHGEDLANFYRQRLTDRHGAPPDPPPKLVILS